MTAKKNPQPPLQREGCHPGIAFCRTVEASGLGDGGGHQDYLTKSSRFDSILAQQLIIMLLERERERERKRERDVRESMNSQLSPFSLSRLCQN